MKILIGICGIGNGHVNRQSNVINLLLSYNHKLVIATTRNNIEYFENNFKNVEVLEVNIPWIACNTKGIDFKTSIKKYDENKIDQFKSFLIFSQKVEEKFGCKPDLIISDYEPNVAQYSYATDIPLICMEQQSKFLYLDEMKIENLSILEEKKRINYFFPKYDYKIISSFFPIIIKDKKVKIVPPIISKLKENSYKKNHILVYLSPYENSLNYIKLLNVLNNINNYLIIVYTKEKFVKKYSKNIIFKEYSNDFKNDLENSYCLISTAGHQLLSESISINIPQYLIPLNTYEQNYNAKMIEKYGLGMLARDINEDEIKKFIKNVEIYKSNIKMFKIKYYKNDWESVLLKIVNKYEFKNNSK